MTRNIEMPKITDVSVRPVSSNERLKAWVTITLNDVFVVKGIRIVMGNSRLFLAMPSVRQRDGTFQELAHPICVEFRQYLEETVLRVYHAQLEESVSARSAAR